MNLAVVGKGGAGKSTVAAVIARTWARRGHAVLAVDLDTNPGLALSLGMGLTDSGLPEEAVEAAEGVAYGHRLRAGLTAEEAVRLYAAVGPDGVRFIQIGSIDRAQHTVARNVTAVRAILRRFNLPGWHVVADLEAGPTTPYEGYANFAELALLVVEPGGASILAAHRLAAILVHQKLRFRVVGNQVRDRQGGAQIRRLASELGAELACLVAYDPALADADRLGIAPADHAPGSPALRSLRKLATMLAS